MRRPTVLAVSCGEPERNPLRLFLSCFKAFGRVSQVQALRRGENGRFPPLVQRARELLVAPSSNRARSESWTLSIRRLSLCCVGARSLRATTGKGRQEDVADDDSDEESKYNSKHVIYLCREYMNSGRIASRSSYAREDPSRIRWVTKLEIRRIDWLGC